MARERQLNSIDISDIPEMVRIVEQVRATHEPCLLQRNGEEIAILNPAPSTKPRVPRGKPFTRDDSIWNLKGIGRSGVRDVSESKYKYLAEAYLDTHDQQA